MRARFDPLDGAGLSWRQRPIRAVTEHLDKTNDGRERRPQLMRHVGEEFALRPVRARQLGRKLFEHRGPFRERPGVTTDLRASNQQRADREDRESPERETSDRVVALAQCSITGDDARDDEQDEHDVDQTRAPPR